MVKQVIEAVDLFCGAGGLSYGLGLANVKVMAGYDIDPVCRYPYEQNTGAKFFEADVTTVTGAEISKQFSKHKNVIRLLAGCAPCQPFSTLAHTNKNPDLKKWSMLDHFSRLVREVQPDLVTMENVPRVTNHGPYDNFKRELEAQGYHVDAKRIRCADLGIPQERRRFVLVASKLGEITFDTPERGTLPMTTVRDAIEGLKPLSAGEVDPDDPLHKARKLSPINMRRMKASQPGGTWEDWPKSLRAPCHQKEEGASYKSVYARMEWDKPSPTITTQCFNFGTGRFGHPEQDRAITLREAAILQSFPEDYVFVQPGESAMLTPLGRLIGNAVPPKLGEAVGRCLLSHVQSN
ncbi:MAG: DNA cytosine methyltransferase [Alphaproteobacteria bacterium]|nr:DNA cytosine methyltransferase [Alphaproteobacteria bacterium]